MGRKFQPFDLGRFRCVEKLGSGGMALIYRAELHSIDAFHKTFAIKKIHRHLAGDARLVRMFVEEARLLAALDHGNIVRILELGKQDGLHYMVLEYVDGVNLRQMLERLADCEARFPPELAVAVAKAVAQALCYIHGRVAADGTAAGLVHQDVSPGNVMLTRFGEVKLLDFGVARPMGDPGAEQSAQPRGTYAYMAPEQLRGEAVDGRSDIFSLGSVLYEMVFGHRLFQGESLAAIMRKVEQCERGPLEGCPPALATVLEKMLARVPADRYKNSADLIRAFDALLFRWGRPAGQPARARFVAQAFGRRFASPKTAGGSLAADHIPRMGREAPSERTAQGTEDTKGVDEYTARGGGEALFERTAQGAEDTKGSKARSEAVDVVSEVLNASASEAGFSRAGSRWWVWTAVAVGLVMAAVGGYWLVTQTQLWAQDDGVSGVGVNENKMVNAQRDGTVVQAAGRRPDKAAAAAFAGERMAMSGGDGGKPKLGARKNSPSDGGAGDAFRDGAVAGRVRVIEIVGKRRKGDLDLHTEPKAAALIHKRKIIGSTPLRVKMQTLSRLDVVLNKEGRRVKRVTLKMFGDSGRKVRIFLPNVRRETETAKPGQTAVQVKCATAGIYRVYLNGWDTGHNCPVKLRVEPGRNNVAIRESGSDRLDYKDFRVHTGETVEVEWNR
jgi:serine/threonine-protein kinase